MLRRLSVFLVVLLVAGSSAQAGTEAFWRFEEGSAPALDISGNDNTGAVLGGTYATSTPLFFAPNDFALRLAGKTDYVEIAAGPGTNLDTFPNGFTLEAFIEPDELPIPPYGAGQRLKYIVWADDDAYGLLLVSDVSGHTT